MKINPSLSHTHTNVVLVLTKTKTIMIFTVMDNGNGPPARMEFPGRGGRETKV